MDYVIEHLYTNLKDANFGIQTHTVHYFISEKGQHSFVIFGHISTVGALGLCKLEQQQQHKKQSRKVIPVIINHLIPV